MTRYMVDSVNLAAMPYTVSVTLPYTVPISRKTVSVGIAAVYRNGLFAADPAKVAERFPAARYVTVWIDVNGTAPQSCQVLDVEKGDAGPNQAPGWIKARRAVVHTSLPTIYCDRSTMPDVVSACSSAGLHAGRDYQLWISTLDGTRFTGVGVVACQFQGGPTAAYDLSVVYDDHWHPLAA